MNRTGNFAALVLMLCALVCGNAAHAEDASTSPSSLVVPKSQIEYQPLNPARGDASPRAGVLWGDIKRDVGSGAIIRFVDGFSSPPHIHNITYRGVVITGAVHNDDPDAARQWMGPGSFWTQPAGEVHITAARPGAEAVIFLEILEGPYLVQPPEDAFDNGERPVNVDATNLQWLNASDVTWLGAGNSTGCAAAQVAFLWGAQRPDARNGTLLRLPTGFEGSLRGNKDLLRAVVIRGELEQRLAGQSAAIQLPRESYFGVKDAAKQAIACTSEDGCLLYVSATGRYQLSSGGASGPCDG
ncbi:MAG: DUF4437 domain-containing protein [Pseudomonadota bacterium]